MANIVSGSRRVLVGNRLLAVRAESSTVFTYVIEEDHGLKADMFPDTQLRDIVVPAAFRREHGLSGRETGAVFPDPVDSFELVLRFDSNGTEVRIRDLPAGTTATVAVDPVRISRMLPREPAVQT